MGRLRGVSSNHCRAEHQCDAETAHVPPYRDPFLVARTLPLQQNPVHKEKLWLCTRCSLADLSRVFDAVA